MHAELLASEIISRAPDQRPTRGVHLRGSTMTAGKWSHDTAVLALKAAERARLYQIVRYATQQTYVQEMDYVVQSTSAGTGCGDKRGWDCGFI